MVQRGISDDPFHSYIGANTAIYLGKHKRKPGVKFAIKLYERENEIEAETRMLTEIVTLAAESDAINKYVCVRKCVKSNPSF